jgi:glycosyltransferase involved in cell wall biosynthesis
MVARTHEPQPEFTPIWDIPKGQVRGGETSSRPGAKGARLAVLLSHPVQYFSPLFKELASRPEIDLTVIYCSLGGAEAHFDPEFGRTVKWDLPLLEGYRYKVLRSVWPGKVEGIFGYFAPGVLREIKAANFDAVVVFGWSSLTCWLGFLKAALSHIPWMLYGDSNAAYERDKTGLRTRLRNWALDALFRRTAALLVSSSQNRRFYSIHGVPDAKCFDVPLVVNNDLFRTTAVQARTKDREIRARHGIPEGATVLLFVGKLLPRKRPSDVLDVVENLRNECPDLAALIVGEGPLRQELAAQVERRQLSKVLLLGFRNQSELPEIYAIADIFLLPSSLEPVGLAVHEALACGLPAIVSDRTGVWGPGDVVRDGQNGIVYRCGNLRALTEAVRKLALDVELRRRMGRRSSEIIGDFSLARSANGIAKATAFVSRKGKAFSRPGLQPQIQETL